MIGFKLTTTILPLFSGLILGADALEACFNLGYGPQGVCNTDPTDASFLETYLNQDHANASCSGGGTFTAIAAFIGVNGNPTTLSAISTQQVAKTYTGLIPFSFNQPLTSIPAAGVVSITVIATNTLLGGSVSQVLLYTQTHLASLTSVQATSTLTSTLTATATSTMPVTITGTVLIHPPDASTVIKSHTSTFYVATPVTTITGTITPKVLTTTSTLEFKITSTRPCISQAVNTLFSVPWCAAPVSTTTTLPATTVSTSVSSTITQTVLTTSTVIITATAASPTRYVSVTATITATPALHTSKVWTLGTRPTVVVSSTLWSIKTTNPSGPGATKCVVSFNLPSPAGTSRLG